MKKILYMVSCVLLFNRGTLYAQNSKIKTSLELGYTNSVRQANLSNFVDSKYNSGYGVGINLSGEYLLWKTLFVATGVSLLEKNYEYRRTEAREKWYTKFSNTYLQVPLSIGGYLINNPYKDKGIWIKVSGGAYAEYWLSMHREGQYPILTTYGFDGTFSYNTVSERYNFRENGNRVNRFGYGLQGGGQLGYSLKKIDIYGSYNYQHGLSDINVVNQNKNKKMTTSAYMISLGVSYKL